LTIQTDNLIRAQTARMSNAPFPRPPRTYAAVTPARDEIENLPRLFASLKAQTVRPAAWMVVANGCTDGTVEYVEQLSLEHDWVHLVQSEAEDQYARAGRPYIAAVHAGVAALPLEPDVLVKLDADVSFRTDFFERILGAFAADPELGITSGACWEESNGLWQERPIPQDHVWGPTRSYRWPDLRFVFPLEENLGQALVDETKAHLAGWRTGTQHDLPFRHHRPEGAADGSKAAWWAEGEVAYFVGYRPLYLIAKTAYRMRTDRAAAALVPGYLAARRHRRPQLSDQAVRQAIRERQRLSVLARRLFVAVREHIAEDRPRGSG
jgi:biofilm PGA synthesis N-glycosyltransferase PgaC